jgi:hypothetical protein
MALFALFAARSILQSADGVLHLAGSLVGFAFSFQFLVAEGLSGRFLNTALDLLRRPFDTIFIHFDFSFFDAFQESTVRWADRSGSTKWRDRGYFGDLANRVDERDYHLPRTGFLPLRSGYGFGRERSRAWPVPLRAHQSPALEPLPEQSGLD